MPLGMKTAAETGQATEQRERTQTFTTISGRPIERLYTAEDVARLAVVHW